MPFAERRKLAAEQVEGGSGTGFGRSKYERPMDGPVDLNGSVGLEWRDLDKAIHWEPSPWRWYSEPWDQVS